jgi:hypothetical protein
MSLNFFLFKGYARGNPFRQKFAEMLIPYILIRTLNVLLHMTNPYLQECLFESIELIRREIKIFDIRIVGEHR